MTESLSATTSAPGDLLIRAAVLSFFDVDWLYPQLANDEADRVVDFLFSSCQRVLDSTETPRWQLRDDERIRVLREVPRSSLLDALNGLVTRPDDPVQQALDRYLRGSFPPVDQLDAAGLSGALQLGRWVGSQPGLPDPAEVQARLDMVTLLDPLRRLLARGFVGRQDLLDELESFIRAENPQRPDVFLIEGIGGSGKSTVLARTVLDLPTRDDLAVYLSFDRGWLIDGGSWAVFDEIVRQVGVGLPARRQAALELRQRAQQQSQRAGGYAEIASRSLQRRDPVGVDLLEELAKLTADHSRLMVVLDTLEELARRDVSYGEELFSFMSALTRSVRQVRVVAAGRSAPAVTSASTRLWQLTGLADHDALDLLRDLTTGVRVSEALLREIVRLLGGNPLSLHLAADVLNRTGKDPTQFIAVVEGNVQGQLYSRLLEHIRDLQVRAIANPGLVVRRLTPDIIRQVLAEPCGIAPLTEAEAAHIFLALRAEATLCEPSPDGDGALVQRQDVRTLMLPAIEQDRPGMTRAIHEAAVRYYETGAPSFIARREELYHRLMLKQDRAQLDQRWLPTVAADLTTVVDELPPRSQLYIATKVGGLRLDPAARAEADDDEWRHAVRPAVTLRMERGQLTEALELVQERRGSDGHPLLPDLEVEALERLGKVQEALHLARKARQRASELGSVEQIRTLISQEARILEQMRRWSDAWTLLELLATLDRNRRARTAALDDEVRIRELVVLTSMLRIARHRKRPDRPVDELTRETVGLAETTPQRILTANPSLLRDLAAEIGSSSPQILQLAVSALATPEDTHVLGASPEAANSSTRGKWSSKFSGASDASQNYQKLCVLTVHGIGFQQPPTDSGPGYADVLHENLSDGLQALGSSLSKDPQRKPGPFGPVYVMSAKPGTHDHEWGLKRLGTWRGDGIDISGMPLADGDEPVAHVALVYTSLEGVGPGIGRGADVAGEAALMLGHYASVAGALRLVVGDAWAALHERAGPGAVGSSPSLRPRDDVLTKRQHHLAALMHRRPANDGALGVVRTLEDDVVSYVCRNDLRESFRKFISEALRRLLARPDVAGVVVNAHSQGTVGSFDVLRLYPPGSLAGVRAFVTAGSPLRKYADLFSWGNDCGGLQPTKWLNFWDQKDPVADPLSPPDTWHYGSTLDSPPSGELGLFYALDGNGNQVPVTITDIEVNNLENSSGGGLQAHNYWDNKTQFIAQLAKLIEISSMANREV